MSADFSLDPSAVDLELQTARRAAQQGRLAEAEAAFRRVVAHRPDQVDALRFLANAALARGDAASAIEHLGRAAGSDRADTGVLLELGVAYRAADKLDSARYVLERVLELSKGGDIVARLLLANVLELDKRPELALPQYFRAIVDAQAQRRWLDDASTETGLQPLVRHAMRYVIEGRRRHYDAVLRPVRERAPAPEALDRIDAALAGYLREREVLPSDPRQRPSFLYVPRLGAAPWVDAATLPWLGAWNAELAPLAAEARACLDATPDTPAAAPFSLSALTATAFSASAERRAVLHERGRVDPAAAAHAPRLLAHLERAPLVSIPDHGPDSELIALAPGGATAPRYGRTNSRLLAVAVLPDSAPVTLTVGGESHTLAAGEACVIDATFGYEVANPGSSSAQWLSAEVWHPALTAIERDALTALIAAVVAFDTQVQEG